eukprot:gene25197-33723_t
MSSIESITTDTNISPIPNNEKAPLSPKKNTYSNISKPVGFSGSISSVRKNNSSTQPIINQQTSMPGKRKSFQGSFPNQINSSSANNNVLKLKYVPPIAGRVSLSPLNSTESFPSKSNSLAPTVPKTAAASRSRPSINRSTSKAKVESEKLVSSAKTASTPLSDNADRNVVSPKESSPSSRNGSTNAPDSPSISCKIEIATNSVDSTYICYEGYGGSSDEQLQSHCDPNDIFLDCDILSKEEANGKGKKHTYQTNPLHAGNSRLSISSMISLGSAPNVENKSSSTSTAVGLELQAALSEAESLGKDVVALKSNLSKKELQLSQCTQMLKNSFLRQAEVEDRASMLLEELHVFKFLNSIQEQKINELEQTISTNRMEHNESMSSKTRKHKAIVKKLTFERSEHEARTNAMISQLNEQMSLLQKMAMERMEVLEKDLMMERHKSAQKIESLERNISTDKLKYSRLMTENNALKAAAAAAAAQKLTPRGMKSNRPLREIDLNDRRTSLSRSYSKSLSKSGCESTSGSTLSTKSRSEESRDSLSSVTEHSTAKKIKRLQRDRRKSEISGHHVRLSMDSSFHSCDSDECSTETVSNKTEPRLSICCQEEEVSDEKDEEPEEVEEQLEDENVAALESSEISDDLENRQLDATSEFEILDCTDTYFIPSSTKEKERVKGSSLLVAAVPTSPILKNWSI